MKKRLLLIHLTVLLFTANSLHAQLGITNDYKNGGQRFDSEKYKSDRDMQESKQRQQYKPDNTPSKPANTGNAPVYRDYEEEKRQARERRIAPKPEFAAFEGQGKAELRDGVYEGYFKYGVLEGKGKLTYNPGDVYEGDFKNGKPHGYGVLTETDGTVYTGPFENGYRKGYATVTYRDGRKYVGGWNNLERDGDGTEYNSSGSVIKQGRWNMGVYTPGKAAETSNTPPTVVYSTLGYGISPAAVDAPLGNYIPELKPVTNVVELTQTDITTLENADAVNCSFFGLRLGMTRQQAIAELKKHAQLSVKYMRSENAGTTDEMWNYVKYADAAHPNPELLSMKWEKGDIGLRSIYFYDSAVALFAGNGSRLMNEKTVAEKTPYNGFLKGGPKIYKSRDSVYYDYLDQKISFIVNTFEDGTKSMCLVFITR